MKLAGVNNLLMAHIHIAPDPVEITEPAGPIAYWFTGGPLPVTNLTEQVNGTLANGYVITDGQLEARDPADPATGTIAGLITAISEGSGVGRRSHGRSESGNIHRLPGDSRAGELRGTLQ